MSRPARYLDEPAAVLGKALLRTGKAMGLTQQEVATAIGKDRSAISRATIDPDSKPGELAAYLIRIYRALFVLVGGDEMQIQHWMHTDNRHTGGVPAEQLKSIHGLIRVMEYLDAIRGKV